MTLPREWLRTDAGAAAVTKAWSEGASQRTLAEAFGYKGAPIINVAIARFLMKWCPEYDTSDVPRHRFSTAVKMLQGKDRREKIAPLALVRYCLHRKRDPQPSAAE